MENEILQYLLGKYPEEACGLIINKRGKLAWVPCENVAPDPLENFAIDPNVYLANSLSYDIHAVVHSHPDTSPQPSPSDIANSTYLGVPYHIYSIPSGEKFVYTPESSSQILGLDYEFGTNDCYGIVRKIYEQDLGITLPTMLFKDDFWLEGIDYFGDLASPYGFKKVDTPEKYDVMLFNVMSPIPNHCGVYMGNDIFIHHAVDRLSCRESVYSPIWHKYLTGFYRYANSLS